MVPSISVVTPSYQQGRYIERTIQSVLGQGIDDLEYVVFDGGSTDETVDILKKYQDKLRWVSEKDRGQSDAVNKGIRATTGNVIGWLNSDDIYYPGALRTVLDYFAAHPECEVIYGDAHHIRDDDSIIDDYYTQPWDFERLKELCYLCQPAVFFNRSVVEKYGSINDALHFCMDYEYWIRLARAGVKFHYLKGYFLAGSRLHESTKTLSQRPKVHAEINEMMVDKFGRVPDQWLFNWAHCLVDEKGISRDSGLKFATAVGVASVYGSLKWNKRISWRVFSTAYNWTFGSAMIKLRSRLRK
ncbi:MAG TPA: glycosyltransferase family 2 protein [Tepidisphaeraceae bacterium]|jgi:glycosyltransferase involved in cell wall biosynthesis